jgi:predicted site-specific integrase-resolvase
MILVRGFDTVLTASGAIMQKRAAIYVRVSTDKQTVENQVAALRQIAERRGWEVVEQYGDAGISALRAATGVQASTRCSRMRPGESSM